MTIVGENEVTVVKSVKGVHIHEQKVEEIVDVVD